MKRYGLIGKKLGHSFSASYFNTKFKKEGIDAIYELFEIPSVEGVSTLINKYPDLIGLNVTIPYKKEILPFLNEITEVARNIGAVNCIKIDRSGDKIRLEGTNSDAPGFRDAIKPMIKPGMDKALVLGQGGASLAVIYALKGLGIEVTKVSRHASEGVITYKDIDEEIMRSHRIIINCTPLGMYPNVDDAPAIPYQFIDNNYLCFDLVYNPEVTKFMRLSADHGAVVSNGLQMLYNQAELAWKFWNGRDI